MRQITIILYKIEELKDQALKCAVREVRKAVFYKSKTAKDIIEWCKLTSIEFNCNGKLFNKDYISEEKQLPDYSKEYNSLQDLFSNTDIIADRWYYSGKADMLKQLKEQKLLTLKDI